MSWSRNWSAFQVGCSYIGTVVGAGFASGQEIYQFFGKFGSIAFVGVLFSVALFAFMGYRLMDLGRRLEATSYRELTVYLFGPVISKVVDWVLLVMLFGLTVAMLAGAGELFHERLGLNFQAGALVTIGVTFVTILGGTRGLLRANTLIVPMMIGFVFFAGVHTWLHRPAPPVDFAAPANSLVPILSAIVYAGLNVGLSVGVLVPLGREINDKQILRRGALLGAAGLGTMLVVILYVLLAYSPTALTYQLPMAYIAAKIGPVVQWMFILVLWGEIYSTLVGNVYSILVSFPSSRTLQRATRAGCLLLLALFLSHIGFSNIVGIGYPIFGWVSLLLLVALIFPSRKLMEH